MWEYEWLKLETDSYWTNEAEILKKCMKPFTILTSQIFVSLRDQSDIQISLQLMNCCISYILMDFSFFDFKLHVDFSSSSCDWCLWSCDCDSSPEMLEFEAEEEEEERQRRAGEWRSVQVAQMMCVEQLSVWWRGWWSSSLPQVQLTRSRWSFQLRMSVMMGWSEELHVLCSGFTWTDE